jgi:PmbA protein
MTPPESSDPLDLGARVVDRACSRGADVAEASLFASSRLSAKVRLGDLELLEEATQRSLALRVVRDHRVGVATTTDVSEAGIERCVTDALMLATLTEPDALAGPAEVALLHRGDLPSLGLFDPAVESVSADEACERARAAEGAALAFDSRLTLSEGATFARASGSLSLVLSTGFRGAWRGTEASLAAAPAAEDADGKKRLGTYYSAHRSLAGLESSSAVGEVAARRALAKLGARRVPTCEAAVIFDPDTAELVLDKLASCVVGGSIWRKASYLLDREGDRVASDLVTILDDPCLPGALGSRPFDGEGLPARRNTVVERGRLHGFLLDCYSARKLGRTSTGNARRTAGSIVAAPTNFHLQPGPTPPERIVADTPRGLYVTELLGFGFNPVTGDFSQGASGHWIEGGSLAFPVSEVTISSNLDRMLVAIDAVGSDLRPKSTIAAPTFRVASMTIGGS